MLSSRLLEKTKLMGGMGNPNSGAPEITDHFKTSFVESKAANVTCQSVKLFHLLSTCQLRAGDRLPGAQCYKELAN